MKNEAQHLSEIKQFYLTAFAELDGKREVPPVRVEFYAYVGLRQTIRIRKGEVIVRLADLMREAPLAVHRALAYVLVAKLLKRRIPKQAREFYENFARQPHVAEQSQETRRARGRKIISSARGNVYDLDEIFTRLNQTYFQNALAKPIITWSRGKTFRIFGHHDALHETVVISRTLDDRTVPGFVAEFVLYHELLHIKHPTEIVNGRRRVHSNIFRRDEQLFPHFAEAEKWLEKLARKRKSAKH
ncbi:MAG: M48 family peptidase [Pyrinomonadaceae bacterium]